MGNFNVAGAIPVAGNFDGILGNGDEIGLYNSGKWGLDFNRNFVIEANEVISTGLFGRPIVGDFDGDGKDDLAVFNNNVFYFNLANDGFDDANDRSLVWGFPGVLDQPVAADMDQDGIDDIGLWVPRTSATPPAALSQWYFLVSNDPVGNLRDNRQHQPAQPRIHADALRLRPVRRIRRRPGDADRRQLRSAGHTADEPAPAGCTAITTATAASSKRTTRFGRRTTVRLRIWRPTAMATASSILPTMRSGGTTWARLERPHHW